jgi:HEAT repeat protein
MPSMSLAKSAGLVAYNALWRATGLPSAGRALVHALDSGDEDVRTIAGMFLVQGGRRARPLLEEALERREHLPMVLRILGDLGDPRAAYEVASFADDPDSEVADAARDSLRVLEFAAAGRGGEQVSRVGTR